MKQKMVKVARGVAFPVPLIEGLIDGYDAVEKAKTKLELVKAGYTAAEDEAREIVTKSKFPASEGFEFVHIGRLVKIGKQRQVTDYKAGAQSMAIAFTTLEQVEPGLAFKLMKFNLADLQKYLTPAQLAQIVKSTDTGPRGVKVE